MQAVGGDGRQNSAGRGSQQRGQHGRSAGRGEVDCTQRGDVGRRQVIDDRPAATSSLAAPDSARPRHQGPTATTRRTRPTNRQSSTNGTQTAGLT